MRFFKKAAQQKVLRAFTVTGLATAVALVAGCSSDNPDEGSDLPSSSLSGIAVDGYLAGAKVYLDYNNNGRLNAGEPSAITDKDGYFSKAKDGTDYCANAASTAQKRYCLSSIGSGNDVVLRSQGGFDIFTGEPFDGSLSARISPDDFEVDGTLLDQKISPLSSMLTNVSDAVKTQILTAYGLNESHLDQDFLSEAGYNADITRAAISFHKVVTIFSELLDDQYDEFGEDFGFPQSTNGLVYKALADQINNLGDLKDLSSGQLSTALTAAFAVVQVDIQALYDADEDLNYSPVDGTAAIANAVKVIGLVANAIPSGTLFAEAKSRVIGVEMVVRKMIEERQENVPDVAQIDAAITEAEDTNSGLYTALEGTSDVDFTALVGVDFTAPNYADIDISGAIPLTDLAEKQLFVAYDEDEDLSDNKSGSAHFFFNADESGIAGTLNACLKYSDGNPKNEPDYTGQDKEDTNVEETEGTLIDGTWFAIDDNRLVLTLEGSFDITLISKGAKGSKTKYSLSYGGETVSWLSDDGLIDDLSVNSVTLPTDNAGCVSLLAPPQV